MEAVLVNNKQTQETHLDASETAISSHIDLTSFVWLTTITLNNCGLVTLPSFPVKTTKLDVTNNRLTSLSLSLPNLITIWCNNNPINYISLECPKLEQFSCCNTHITCVPDLSNTVVTLLELSRNKIDKITSLPDTVETVDISYCNLTRLPEMKNVRTLYAFHNKIECAVLPDTIVDADLSHNYIRKFDSYPPNIETLDLSNNRLSYIPDKYPHTLTQLDISDNNIVDFNETYHDIDYFKYDMKDEIDDYEDRLNYYVRDIELEEQLSTDSNDKQSAGSDDKQSVASDDKQSAGSDDKHSSNTNSSETVSVENMTTDTVSDDEAMYDLDTDSDSSAPVFRSRILGTDSDEEPHTSSSEKSHKIISDSDSQSSSDEREPNKSSDRSSKTSDDESHTKDDEARDKSDEARAKELLNNTQDKLSRSYNFSSKIKEDRTITSLTNLRPDDRREKYMASSSSDDIMPPKEFFKQITGLADKKNRIAHKKEYIV